MFSSHSVTHFEWSQRSSPCQRCHVAPTLRWTNKIIHISFVSEYCFLLELPLQLSLIFAWVAQGGCSQVPSQITKQRTGCRNGWVGVGTVCCRFTRMKIYHIEIIPDDSCVIVSEYLGRLGDTKCRPMLGWRPLGLYRLSIWGCREKAVISTSLFP